MVIDSWVTQGYRSQNPCVSNLSYTHGVSERVREREREWERHKKRNDFLISQTRNGTIQDYSFLKNRKMVVMIVYQRVAMGEIRFFGMLIRLPFLMLGPQTVG